jgi:hypothetical protein
MNLVGRLYRPSSNVLYSQDILDNAMQLNLQSGNISAIMPDGNYLMAVPIQQS